MYKLILLLAYLVATLAIFIKSLSFDETKKLGVRTFLVIPICVIMFFYSLIVKWVDDDTGISVSRIRRIFIYFECFKGLSIIVMMEITELKIVDLDNSKLLKMISEFNDSVNYRIFKLYKTEHSL